MRTRTLHLLLFTLLFAICGALAAPQTAEAAEASPNRSLFTTSASSTTVVPYQSFSVTIDLRDATGNAMTRRPRPRRAFSR